MSTTKYLDLAGLQYLKTKMDARYVTSADIESALSTYKQGLVTIVSSLPASGEEGLLYLVPDSNASSGDVYTTWVWEPNSWAQIGGATLTPITVDSTVIEDSTNAVSGGAVYHELAYKLDASELTTSITEDGTNAVTSGAIYSALALKLDSVDVDTSVIEDSAKPVSGGAVYDELASKLDASELTSNITEYGTNAVTSGAIYDALALKLDASDVESIETTDIDSLFA